MKIWIWRHHANTVMPPSNQQLFVDLNHKFVKIIGNKQSKKLFEFKQNSTSGEYVVCSNAVKSKHYRSPYELITSC